MAKSESTAVNELISLVQNGPKRGDEPAQDLFAAPKPSRAPSPQPLERAPTGTSQLHLNNGKPVRMVTAPPTRTQSIPPLPNARAAQVRASTPPPPRPSAAKVPPPRTASQHAAVDPARASTQLPAVDPLAAIAAWPVASTPPAKAPAATLPPPAQLRAPAAEPPTKKLTPKATPAVRPTPANAIPVARTTPPKSAPVAAPFESRVYGAPAYERAAIDKTGDSVSADNWFEASRAVEKIDETWVGTQPAAKRRDHSAAIKRVLLPLVVLSVVSAAVAYVVFEHHGKKVAPPVTHVAAPAQKAAPAATTATAAAPSTESPNAATASAGGVQPEPPTPAAAPAANMDGPGPAAGPGIDQAAMAPHPNANEQKIVGSGTSEPAAQQVAAAPAETAPAPVAPVAAAKVAAIAEAAPVVHEVQSAHGVVKLVDVRIDSKPAGATVMLVDNGKTQFLGTTPVAASVDPSRSYDVVLTLEGRPTQIAHLDPNKAQKLEITLAKGGAAKAETPRAPAPRATAPKTAAPARVSHAKKSSAPSGGIVDPGFDTPAEQPKAEAPKAAGGEGTLMVSSKPPCQIWVDGNDTGLTTPQRAMKLPAGAHKVTFVNAEQNITKTVSVMITGGESTKLIQNLLAN